MTPMLLSLLLSAASCPAPSSAPAPRTCHYGPGQTQDHACTPGATETDDLAVICHTTTPARRCKPSPALKRAILAAYGVASAGEIDHLISLELGGSNSVENLWPEPASQFRAKDVLENWVHREVCAGRVSLAAGRAMLVDFAATLARMGGKVPRAEK